MMKPWTRTEKDEYSYATPKLAPAACNKAGAKGMRTEDASMQVLSGPAPGGTASGPVRDAELDGLSQAVD